jgi:dTDP-4-amino-4,6-dideoxygalactose transaminase
MKHIPYGRQFLDKKDKLSVLSSLSNDLITTGPYVKIFENKTSNFLNNKYSLSCNSGTSALHLSFCAVELKKNDVVIMPAVNFIAAYNAASNFGAKIYLADVDENTGQMTPKTLLECIKKFKLKKIKIILTMYMGGFPENVYEFYGIKKKYDCILIEDACHAFGAEYYAKNRLYKVGSCNHSDIATFSFHPLKPITTGEGGLLSTNNKKFYDIAKNFRSHGIIRNKTKHWDYDVKNFGYNYRLSDINCALGISQLKKINLFLNKRKKIYINYKAQLDGFQNILSFPKYNTSNSAAYHLVIINIKFKDLNSKDKFINYLLRKKIIVQFHYKPINFFSVYKEKNIKLPYSMFYYNNSISIPIYHSISKKEVKHTVQTIKNYVIKNYNLFTNNH